MIQQSTFKFLKDLKKNNNREWFEKNRPRYEQAKNNFIEYVDELIANVSKFDPALKGLEAKKCLFRINRDVRFSNDKSPYKTNFGASINPGGKKSPIPGYYVHIEAGECFIAGGSYMPEPDKLKAIRQEIDYNLKEFKKIVEEKTFKKLFKDLYAEGKLVTAPKGYPKEHVAIEFLKLKHFIASYDTNEKEALSKAFPKKSIEVCKALYPLNKFLRRAMD